MVRATRRGEQSILRAVCGSTGIRLGEVDSFQSATNATTGALAIRTVSRGVIRVLLVTADAGGRVLVQDISGELARTAGRHPDAGLAGVTIDLQPFATLPAIGVSLLGGAATGSRSASRRLDLTQTIAAGQRLAAERPVASGPAGATP